jgi:hypothetical protein
MAAQRSAANNCLTRDYFNLAARPPRRFVILLARLDNSAITSDRASAVIRDHAPISSIDRKQPVHKRLSGWITQILMHGLSISARDQM